MNDAIDTKEEELLKARATRARSNREETAELRKRLVRETNSLQGEGFEIVETIEGPIGLVAQGEVLYKRFQAALQEKKITTEDFYDFVSPCVVHPPKEKYDPLFSDKPAYVNRCANALVVLYGGKGDDERGKY